MQPQTTIPENTTISEDEFLARMRQKQRNAEQRCQSPAECARILLAMAKGDTSGSYCCAGILLAYWNQNFKVSLRDVMSARLDILHSAAAQGLIHAAMNHQRYIDGFLSYEDMLPVLRQWGATFWAGEGELILED